MVHIWDVNLIFSRTQPVWVITIWCGIFVLGLSVTIIRTVGWIWILESFATDASTFFTTLFVQLIHFKNIRPNFYNLCSLISLPLVCENLKSYQSSPWLDQYIINTMLLNKYDNLPVHWKEYCQRLGPNVVEFWLTLHVHAVTHVTLKGMLFHQEKV